MIILGLGHFIGSSCINIWLVRWLGLIERQWRSIFVLLGCKDYVIDIECHVIRMWLPVVRTTSQHCHWRLAVLYTVLLQVYLILQVSGCLNVYVLFQMGAIDEKLRNVWWWWCWGDTCTISLIRGNHGETTVDPEQCTFHLLRNVGVISPICGCDGHLTLLSDTSSSSLPSTVFTKTSVITLTASYYKGKSSVCLV